jgi:[acyl-carrier-protein] S-malonyltransferase
MNIALLFPGQGVQHEAMLPWLEDNAAAAPVLARMALAIGRDWRQRLHDAAWAESNRVAQCLITGTSLAAWKAIEAGLPRPVAVAGYSVGEVAAFSAAGVFDAEAALSLASSRAEAMDQEAALAPGALLSVAGPPSTAIEAACERWSLEVAIRIAPDRCMLGGRLAAIESAFSALADQGAEVQRLRVGLASHTSLMRTAAARFAERLRPLAWQAPRLALVSNRAGRTLRTVSELKQAFASQIDHTVAWDDCIATVAERRPRAVLEVGAGTSLSRMWSAAQPEIPVRSVDEFGSAEAVLAWVRERS